MAFTFSNFSANNFSKVLIDLLMCDYFLQK